MRAYFSFFCLLAMWLAAIPTATAALNVSPFFITLSDAMAEVKQQQPEQAQTHLLTLQQQFRALPESASPQGQLVTQALQQAVGTPTQENLDQLSKALYAFEKEQNPVDYAAKRRQFAKRVMPVYEALQHAVQTRQLETVQQEYKRFNATWTANEKAVRDTSLAHYGQIETAMTLLRVAMLSDPPDYAGMSAQTDTLGQALNAFKAGDEATDTPAADNAPQTLPDGIALLSQSHQQLLQQQTAQANAGLLLFIRQWPIFEGEVRTRDGALYTRVESELPQIMAKSHDPQAAVQLKSLIDGLNRLDLQGSYGMIDAMLILLREGVEALLIIIALLSALEAAKQPRAKRWVYAGAGLGLAASLLSAVALQQLFPALTAGTQREILEGAVGIAAVLMMLLVGAWLHSKASVAGWKAFVDRHIHQALATGSLMSMLLLSFLSVFREGAETLLFYAGMLPLISLQDLLGGIALALLCLAFALLMRKGGKRLPIPTLFKLMTVLIYVLGFKILGVSIHALQLTQVLPSHPLDSLPTLPAIGLYATAEGLGAQLLYLALIPLSVRLFRRE